MFTGDRSGDFLYAALHRAGFANQPTSVRQGDGAPPVGGVHHGALPLRTPENKPLPDELTRCSSWLDREVSALRNVRVVLALGSIGGERRSPTSSGGAEDPQAPAAVRTWSGGSDPRRASAARLLSREPAEYEHAQLTPE